MIRTNDVHIVKFGIADVFVDIRFGDVRMVDPCTNLVAGCGWILDFEVSSLIGCVTHFLSLSLYFLCFYQDILVAWPHKRGHRFIFKFILKDET